MGDIDFDYETVERECIKVKTDEDNGCETDPPATGTVRNLLEKTFGGLDLGEITFKGKSCLTSDKVDGKSTL